jgi:hypothetical protein
MRRLFRTCVTVDRVSKMISLQHIATSREQRAGEVVVEYEDVIDWDWPLRPPPPVEEEAPADADKEAAEIDEAQKEGEL